MDSSTFACGEVGQVALGGSDNRRFACGENGQLATTVVLLAQDTAALLTTHLKNKKTNPDGLVFLLVGEGGFEPPKAKPADLQSVPFGHSGTLPNLTATTIPQQNPFVKGKNHFFQTIFWGFRRRKTEISLDGAKETCYTGSVHATVAQLVEQLTRNEQVARSNRVSSSNQTPCACAQGVWFY